MRWFGPSWDAPINESVERMPVPSGHVCAHHGCGETIDTGDRGVAIPLISDSYPPEVVPVRDTTTGDVQPHLVYHLRCHLLGILGSGEKVDELMAGLDAR